VSAVVLSSNKDLRRLLKEAEEAGWEFRKGGRHIKGVHRGAGRTATVSISPSDPRAILNVKRDLKV